MVELFKQTKGASNGVPYFIKNVLVKSRFISATQDGGDMLLAVVQSQKFDMHNGIVMCVSAPIISEYQHTPFTCSYLKQTSTGLVDATRDIHATQEEVEKYVAKGVTLSKMVLHMNVVRNKDIHGALPNTGSDVVPFDNQRFADQRTFTNPDFYPAEKPKAVQVPVEPLWKLKAQGVNWTPNQMVVGS